MHSNLNVSSQLFPLADISCIFINYKFLAGSYYDAWRDCSLMRFPESSSYFSFPPSYVFLVFHSYCHFILQDICLCLFLNFSVNFLQTFFFNNSCSIRSSSRSRSICCSSFTLLSILVVLHGFKLLSFLHGQPFFFSVFILVIHLFIFPLLGFNFGMTFFILRKQRVEFGFCFWQIAHSQDYK